MLRTVYREKYFSASHRIRNYNGKCENPHGHNWKVRVYVSSKTLDETGFVIDFKLLDSIMETIMSDLDHKDLNTVPPFDSELNPTAENIAEYLFLKAEKELGKIRKNLLISRVMVWESHKSCAVIESDFNE
ncbi:MAG: 6-carboxytetrahydropterin synthase QueD [bacterium]